jgi:hypothetical protein
VLVPADALYHTAIEHGFIAEGQAAISVTGCHGRRIDEEQRA